VHIETSSNNYLDIPTSVRLGVAKKVYEVLEQNDWFWCHFYRVLGYHLELEGKTAEAALARRDALTIAEKLLADPENKPMQKQLLLIAGAMRHFLEDNNGALKNFREAIPLEFNPPDWKEEDARGTNAYMTELMQEYIKKIEAGEPIPRN